MDEETFDKQVAFFVETYKNWLINMQRDAYAQGTLISPEVIAAAFEELREYYDILSDMPDIDDVINKLLGEE